MTDDTEPRLPARTKEARWKFEKLKARSQTRELTPTEAKHLGLLYEVFGEAPPEGNIKVEDASTDDGATPEKPAQIRAPKSSKKTKKGKKGK